MSRQPPAGAELIPPDEQRQLALIIRAAAASDPETAADIAAALRSLIAARARRLSKSAYDGRARILIGARVPRHTADRYRAAAAAAGKSMYRWVCDALDAAAPPST